MTIDEKCVFIQKQSIIISLKALVLLKCFNTFVHNCILLSLMCRKHLILLVTLSIYKVNTLFYIVNQTVYMSVIKV